MGVLTLVTTEAVMPDKNEAWSRCITALLERHNLTLRGAANKTGKPGLRVYLADWLNGQIPQYNTAVDFLEHFPTDEAVECMRAAGYAIPEEWRPTDPVKRVEIALDNAELTPLQLQQIKEYLKERFE